MNRRRLVRWTVALALPVASGCSLFVSLGDLQNGAADVGDAAVADAISEASDSGCPSGKGPAMVNLSYGYCIDSTEVSQSQYQAFLDAITAGYMPPTPPRCDWNPTYSQPTDGWCVTQPNDPVACANWCDAYAFCEWAGKHLCGVVGGGGLPAVDAAVDPSTSAWAKACTANNSHDYSYGSTYEPVCNVPERDGGGLDLDATLPVGSESMCQGPPGVYDLVGNASEWIDACDENDAGFNDNCAHLGGAAGDPYHQNCVQLDWDTRSFQEHIGYAQGFRCCSP